jgi:Domain of unknown function (DUF6484)
MRSTQPDTHPAAPAAAPAVPALSSAAPVMGELLEVRQGRPVVRVAGGPEAGVLARVMGPLLAPGQALPPLPCPALLFLEGGDTLRPVLMGLVQDRLPSGGALVLDLERVVLQGHTEVQLRCGEASVTLRADGKLLLKGAELVAQARGTHKIRGATVQIN